MERANSMWDFINPWGALRKARKELQRTHNESWAQLLEADVMICRLKTQIGNGHFRNPKTGRLGRKGETFDV